MRVTKIAAIWLLVTVDASRPTAVEPSTKINAASASVAKLPLTGTPKTVVATAVSNRKLTIASTM